MEAAPTAREETFARISANEWLVHNAPYSHGDISLFALNADETLSRKLDTTPGTALFAIERITWAGGVPITHVRLIFAPGYRMRTEI
ncbi:UTRA domain-containing protein [Roseibium salinum]|nr:UTRA domain-containing protein [Roseibium salinum]